MRPIERSPLGKPAAYTGRYDAALLFPVARAPQRAALGIGGALPFSGADLWTAYELSWLDARGKPAIAIGTFRVPADSPNIVESKSMKLYLNSFSETRFDAGAEVERTLRTDLSGACGGAVDVALADPGSFMQEQISPFAGESIDDLDLDIDEYSPAPHRLSATREVVEETLVSGLFKSNCPVTGQPDWGSVQLRYRGGKIDRAGLLRYLVSYRQHCGFHEHCAERIFVDIMERCRPERLTVYMRFTRRGGIDINPFRSNWEAPPVDNVPTARQ